MAGLDGTAARTEASENAQDVQPGVEYRVPHESRLEIPEPDERGLEASREVAEFR